MERELLAALERFKREYMSQTAGGLGAANGGTPGLIPPGNTPPRYPTYPPTYPMMPMGAMGMTAETRPASAASMKLMDFILASLGLASMYAEQVLVPQRWLPNVLNAASRRPVGPKCVYGAFVGTMESVVCARMSAVAGTDTPTVIFEIPKTIFDELVAEEVEKALKA